MELTVEQRRVVDHRGGPARVVGAPGHGKTTALVARYLHLLARHPPGAVLVVCRDRAGAQRFLAGGLAGLTGGFDSVPVTTWFALAFDVVRRAGRRVDLLAGAAQRATVARLLAAESAADWPLTGAYLGREAFAAEVADALLALQAGPPERDPPAGPWREVARFAPRYLAHLAERSLTDRAGLFALAAEVATAGDHAQVVVDDYQGEPAHARLLAALAGDAEVVVATADPSVPLPWPAPDIALTQPQRPAATRALVECRHPSAEPEAVAGELLAARSDGLAWSEMAVVVPRPRVNGHRVARALRRHGIAFTASIAVGGAHRDPAVEAIVAVLRWVGGPPGPPPARLLASPLRALGAGGLAALGEELADLAPTATPVDLAFTVWARGLGHLADGDPAHAASLDAVVDFVARLDRMSDADPGLRLADLLAAVDRGEVGLRPGGAPGPASGDGSGAVTVTDIAGACGRTWPLVVLTGCVEGDLPCVRARIPLFDPDLLAGHCVPASLGERRSRSLAAERAAFDLACSRATRRLVATAGPQPGVLLSRFVERWPRAPARPARAPGTPPPARAPTSGPGGVFADHQLRLSASQLDTYDDCPLRYAYEYGVRVRDEAGAPAALGTLVHEVLAEFLRPDPPGGPVRDRSRAALTELAAERWRDDIARYRPQVEECRRDYFAMLDDWWAVEGEGAQAPQVLAVEHRFEVEVAGVTLVGAIDRVDRAPAGEGIRVVDYKTGRREPRAGAVADDLQLAVYHLAATLDPDLAAHGPPRDLRLLYLRTMHAFEQPVRADHAETTGARVAAMAAHIRAGHFEASVDGSCRTCAFHRLCPLQPPGREVDGR